MSDSKQAQQEQQQPPQKTQLQPQPQLQQQSTQNQQISHHSQIPTQFLALSRNNSNASTTSSSNKGDFSSNVSTAANSVTSSRNQLSKTHQLLDHRQLLATCGVGNSSTPMRSFQRATISSAVKTRAFDNNPALQSLLATPSPSSQNSVSNSQTTSPLSTPVFSRSRSLRMSGGLNRYQRSPSNYSRTSTRTPDLHSFTNANNITDHSSCLHESTSRLTELNNEKIELKESLEFLECERQVLIDSTMELRNTLHNERDKWKQDTEQLKKQNTDILAAKLKAESQLVQHQIDKNDLMAKMKRLEYDLAEKNKQVNTATKNLEVLQRQSKDWEAQCKELALMATEKFKYNCSSMDASDCLSVVTDLARLRLELNAKDEIIENLTSNKHLVKDSVIDRGLNTKVSANQDIESLNKFLDQTVECIKGWPEELASSAHVQDLMRSLLGILKMEKSTTDLTEQLEDLHLI